MGANPNAAEGGKHPWFPLRLLLARRDLVAPGVLPQCLMSPGDDGTRLRGTDGDRLMVAMVDVFADVFGFAGLRAVPDALAVPPALIAQVPRTVQEHLRAQRKPVSRVAPRGERAVARWHPLACCCGPTFASLHAMGACFARGMRPSRGGLIAIVSAPLERAHSNRTMSSDDDGFVAALRGMGIAMRREATAAKEEEDSDDTTEDAHDAFIAGVGIGDVYGMVDEMILAMADDLTESVRTAKAYAALLGLPRLAGAGARHSESDVSLRDVIGDLVETASHLSSIPSVLSCIDAIVAGVPDEDIAALFKDDKLLCFVAENGRPEAILRLLWRAGFIEPTYRNGEVSYTDTDLCEATHIQSGEDAPEPYMYSVIRDRLAARTWRVVKPLPFSIGPALRIFDSIAFKDYEWAKAASQWMRQWGKKATKKSGSEKENRKSKVSPTTGNTAAFSTTNLRTQHCMAACEGCFSLLTVLSALATARLPAGVKRPRLEDDEFHETQQAESTSPALAKLKKSVQKPFSSYVDV